MTEQPRARRFLANVRWEHLWGPGSLTIGTGELEVAGLRRRETLSPSDVTVDTAILWVPWANVYVRFEDSEAALPVLAIPLWMRRPVIRSFEQAGYRVHRKRHLFAWAARQA